MSRRFWAAAMLVSLLTMAGGAAFLYKTSLDNSTVTMPLQPAEPAPARVEPPQPVEEKAPPASASAPQPALRNIQFVYINSNAKDVFIVGNFQEGRKLLRKPMEKNRNKWSITLKLAPGTYEYSYVVNGRSVRDPYNKKTSNGKSLITVKPLQAN